MILKAAEKSLIYFTLLFLFFNAGILYSAGNGEYDEAGADEISALEAYRGSMPDEMEIDKYLSIGEHLPEYKDNPIFSEEKIFENLPPVEERLPDEPLFVKPEKNRGQYGGVLNGAAVVPDVGTFEIITWRQSNLFKFSKSLDKIVPHAAKGWEWSDNFRQLKITLRKGHKWSDGTPFTSDDVLFWWNDIVLNSDLTDKIPFHWIRDGKPVVFSKINKTEFEISSDFPISDLLHIMTDVRVRPFACKNYLENFHIKYNPEADNEAVKAGFSSWAERFNSIYDIEWEDAMNDPDYPSINSHLIVEGPDENGRLYRANPYFFAVDIYGNQLPYISYQREQFAGSISGIKELIISGSVDEKSQYLNMYDYQFYDENTYEGKYSVDVINGGSTRTVLFAFNATHKDPVKRKVFSDIRFRKAMSLAVDREEISEVVFGGETVIQQAVPTMEASFVGPELAKMYTEYNPEAAAALLDEMGLKKNKEGRYLYPDGRILKIDYGYSEEAGPVIVNELLKKYWENIGIIVELKKYSQKDERGRLWRNDQDIAVWKAEELWEISMIRNLDFYIPPFNDTNPLVGLPWVKWFETSGREGLEPPGDIIRLKNLAEKAKITIPGSDEYTSIRSEMVKILVDNLWITGTVGHSKRIIITSDRLLNFPDEIGSTEYSYMIPFRPYQWYLDK
jgi:peptide/nickel transport system substrate-binding protein